MKEMSDEDVFTFGAADKEAASFHARFYEYFKKRNGHFDIVSPTFIEQPEANKDGKIEFRCTSWTQVILLHKCVGFPFENYLRAYATAEAEAAIAAKDEARDQAATTQLAAAQKELAQVKAEAEAALRLAAETAIAAKAEAEAAAKAAVKAAVKARDEAATTQLTAAQKELAEAEAAIAAKNDAEAAAKAEAEAAVKAAVKARDEAAKEEVAQVKAEAEAALRLAADTAIAANNDVDAASKARVEAATTQLTAAQKELAEIKAAREEHDKEALRALQVAIEAEAAAKAREQDATAQIAAAQEEVARAKAEAEADEADVNQLISNLLKSVLLQNIQVKLKHSETEGQSICSMTVSDHGGNVLKAESQTFKVFHAKLAFMFKKQGIESPRSANPVQVFDCPGGATQLEDDLRRHFETDKEFRLIGPPAETE